MNKVIPFPVREPRSENARADAKLSLDEALDSLDDAVTNFSAAGDHKMAQSVSAHMHRLRALRERRP